MNKLTLTEAQAEKAQRENMAEVLAQLTLRGVGLNKQVAEMQDQFKDLTLTRTRLDQLRKHPRYKEIIQHHFEHVSSLAVLEGRLKLTGLIPDAITALKHLIKVKKNVNAIALVFKNAGMETIEETKQAQAITVIMPGGKPSEKTIDVSPNKPKGPKPPSDV